MKKSLSVLAQLLGTVVIFSGIALAGGVSTSGQGSRALSMGGAFTAIADDASAVYYNPAGLTRMRGSTVMFGIVPGWAQLDYTVPGGAGEKSTDPFLGMWLFAVHRLCERVAIGLSVDSPFARKAEFGGDPANGFLAQRASVMRTDVSGVLAFRVNQRLSFSGGLIAGRSSFDQMFPAGVAVSIGDKMAGWGAGGTAGVLVSPGQIWRLGAMYRTSMNGASSGRQQVITPGATLTDSAKLEARWPAAVVMGIGVFPTSRLKLAVDADWTEWSHADKFVTTTKQPGGATLMLGERNTWDERAGTEVLVSRAWAVRGGFSRLPRAAPMRSVLPTKPDADGFTIDAGAGWTSARWGLDFSYEYLGTNPFTASGNRFGFPGQYNVTQHAITLTLTRKFEGKS